MERAVQEKACLSDQISTVSTGPRHRDAQEMDVAKQAIKYNNKIHNKVDSKTDSGALFI